MARWRRPAAPAAAGIGAVAGLLAAAQLGGPDAALPLMVAGAVAGIGWSFWRFPDDGVCRIPWWLWGCGGTTTVRDTAGHSRPQRPCWGHPGGRPKRLVNLAVVVGEVVLGVVLVVVLVAVARSGP